MLDVGDFRSDERGKSAVVFDASFNDDLSLADLERVYLRRVLARTGGHKANAAKILGLDRRTLYRKVAELEGGSALPTDPPDAD